MMKNFGLSEEEFKQLIIQLKSDDLFLFEQIFLSHFKDCIAYIQKNYGASYDDAYDASMDTLLVFRKRLLQEKVSYGNLRFLYTKMSSQIYQKNMAQTKKVIQQKEIYKEEASVQEIDLSILDRAWPDLSEACQQLLKLHYYGKAKLSEIAEEDGKSATSIRKQKERCVGKLKSLFVKYSKAYQDV